MGRAGCVLEEFKHAIAFVRMFLGDEFIVTMENLCINLLIWKLNRWFVNLL